MLNLTLRNIVPPSWHFASIRLLLSYLTDIDPAGHGMTLVPSVELSENSPATLSPIFVRGADTPLQRELTLPYANERELSIVFRDEGSGDFFGIGSLDLWGFFKEGHWINPIHGLVNITNTFRDSPFPTGKMASIVVELQFCSSGDEPQKMLTGVLEHEPQKKLTGVLEHEEPPSTSTEPSSEETTRDPQAARPSPKEDSARAQNKAVTTKMDEASRATAKAATDCRGLAGGLGAQAEALALQAEAAGSRATNAAILARRARSESLSEYLDCANQARKQAEEALEAIVKLDAQSDLLLAERAAVSARQALDSIRGLAAEADVKKARDIHRDCARSAKQAATAYAQGLPASVHDCRLQAEQLFMSLAVIQRVAEIEATKTERARAKKNDRIDKETSRRLSCAAARISEERQLRHRQDEQITEETHERNMWKYATGYNFHGYAAKNVVDEAASHGFDGSLQVGDAHGFEAIPEKEVGLIPLPRRSRVMDVLKFCCGCCSGGNFA